MKNQANELVGLFIAVGVLCALSGCASEADIEIKPAESSATREVVEHGATTTIETDITIDNRPHSKEKP